MRIFITACSATQRRRGASYLVLQIRLTFCDSNDARVLGESLQDVHFSVDALEHSVRCDAVLPDEFQGNLQDEEDANINALQSHKKITNVIDFIASRFLPRSPMEDGWQGRLWRSCHCRACDEVGSFPFVLVY